MTAKIYELEDYRPGVWDWGYVRCTECKHEYTSVHHIKSDKLECPNCWKMTVHEVWEEGV